MMKRDYYNNNLHYGREEDAHQHRQNILLASNRSSGNKGTIVRFISI